MSFESFKGFKEFGGEAVSAPASSPLLTDLVEWWEDANSTGKHALLSLLNISAASSVVTGPNGLNAWECDTPTTINSTTVDNAGDFTLAILCRKTVAADFHILIDSTAWQFLWWSTTRLLGRYFGASSIDNYGVVRGTWQSVVISKSGSTVTLYIDGVGVTNTTWSDTGAVMVRLAYADGQAIAIYAVANRAWSQADVDYFHNGGAFLTYADL